MKTLRNPGLVLLGFFFLFSFMSAAWADSVVEYSLTGPGAGGVYTLKIESASPKVTDIYLTTATKLKYYFDSNPPSTNWSLISHQYPNGMTAPWGMSENSPTTGTANFTIKVFMYGLNQPPPQFEFSHGDSHEPYDKQNLVPEPATIISGLLGLAGFALRKFRG